jgi:hypothetical protein
MNASPTVFCALPKQTCKHQFVVQLMKADNLYTNLSLRKRISEQKNSIPVGMLFSFGGTGWTQTSITRLSRAALNP